MTLGVWFPQSVNRCPKGCARWLREHPGLIFDQSLKTICDNCEAALRAVGYTTRRKG